MDEFKPWRLKLPAEKLSWMDKFVDWLSAPADAASILSDLKWLGKAAVAPLALLLAANFTMFAVNGAFFLKILRLKNDIERLEPQKARQELEQRKTAAASPAATAASLDVRSATPCAVAQEIMGDNFLGIEASVEHFGVKPSEADQKALATVPWSEAVLRECAETHVLVADFGLSILDIRRQHATLFCGQYWYGDELFAAARRAVCWRLIRKDVVPDSFSKTYTDQLALLSANDEVPIVGELIYAAVLWKAWTEEIWFKNLWIRVASFSSDGYRVHVRFYDGRLSINYWYDNARDYIALASSRKFPKK